MLMDEIIAATLTEDAEATMLDYAAVDARTRSRFIPSATLRNFTPCGTIGGGPLTGRQHDRLVKLTAQQQAGQDFSLPVVQQIGTVNDNVSNPGHRC
jgi:hypothetical protein